MAALLIGIVFSLFAVFSVLPVSGGLQWWPYVIDFLRGSIPVFVLFIGVIAILIGIADIRDRIEEKKEEQKEQEDEGSAEDPSEDSSGDADAKGEGDK